jgi:prefoldin subunit 5
MEKGLSEMLTSEQKQEIARQIREFQSKSEEYHGAISVLEALRGENAVLKEILSNVAKEERQMETAIDVLYRQPKQVSKAKDIEMQIINAEEKQKGCLDDLNRIENELLVMMRNLPIPVNLEEPEKNNSGIVFCYFQGLELGENAVQVLSMLIRQQLVFDEVIILPGKVEVKNVSDKNEAIGKLVEAIQCFRMRIDTLSESYGKIDELIERLTKSKIYAGILVALKDRKELSVQEIAKALNTDERTAYDGCYNLTRSNWSPSPIRRTLSGGLELTLTGDILVKRLSETHPEILTKIPQESVK